MFDNGEPVRIPKAVLAAELVPGKEKAAPKAAPTVLLSDAIGAAEDAAMQMNALNLLYNVDVSTYTLLAQALHANSGQEMLEDHLAQSTPGEEEVIFNQVPDGNGGQPLPNDPLFGEVVVGTPIIAPAQVSKALAPQKDTESVIAQETETLD